MGFVYHSMIHQIWVVSHSVAEILGMALLTYLKQLYLFDNLFSPFYNSFVSFNLRCLLESASEISYGCTISNFSLCLIIDFVILVFQYVPIGKFKSNLLLTFLVVTTIEISLPEVLRCNNMILIFCCFVETIQQFIVHLHVLFILSVVRCV